MLASLRKLFAAPTRKSLAQPTADELAIFAGIVPGSGMVSAAVAIQVPAVSHCIRLISEGVASLDRRVVRVVDGVETESTEHPATRFLVDHWNEWTSPFEGVRDLVAGALTNDHGGVQWVNRIGGEVREIVQYQTLAVTIDTVTGEPKYELSGRALKISDVVHVRGPFSRAPLTLARETIGTAYTMAQRAAKLFQNASRPAGWIEFAEFLEEEAFNRMKASWEAAHGAPENSGKTAILFGGAKFHPVEFKSTDAQFLELKREQVVEIGRAFGIPPGQLFEMGRQTWANYETADRSYRVETLEAWIRVTEAALSRALLSDDDRRAGYRVSIDRDDLTRSDLVARATAINSLRASEVLSADEARSWLGMGPRPADKLDDYRNPNITLTTSAPAAGSA